MKGKGSLKPLAAVPSGFIVHPFAFGWWVVLDSTQRPRNYEKRRPETLQLLNALQFHCLRSAEKCVSKYRLRYFAFALTLYKLPNALHTDNVYAAALCAVKLPHKMSKNMKQIKIPDDRNFLADLILQRTGVFLKLGGAVALNNWFALGDKEGLVNFLVGKNLLEVFLKHTFQDISLEIAKLRSHIPTKSLNKIISIGPGNGLCELFLISQGYTSELLLVDIEATEHHHHGFNSKGSGYASLIATKNFILENTSSNVKILACNPQKEQLPNFEYTLLLSLLSMGFHYACDEYAEFILNQATAESIVILDKRRGTPDYGFDKLMEGFSLIGQLPLPKSDRVILKRCSVSQDPNCSPNY